MWERNIEIDHQNADSIVLWNPWDAPPSAMQPNDYQHMVCVETARLNQLLSFKQQLAVEILVKKYLNLKNRLQVALQAVSVMDTNA